MGGIGWPPVIEVSAVHIKLAINARLGKLLPGEYERNVPSLTAERHTAGKRLSRDNPSDVYTQALVHPCLCGKGGLVVQRLNHSPELRLGPAPGPFGNEAD